MTDFNDDPREVLALLNSLGFIGITAPQLKAFMKDLKLYRKIKEREKQQWKEEIRRKILSKQQRMAEQILNEERQKLFGKKENCVESDSLSVYIDDSLIKLKIRCLPQNENEHSEIQHKKPLKYADTREHVTITKEKSTKESKLQFVTHDCVSKAESKLVKVQAKSNKYNVPDTSSKSDINIHGGKYVHSTVEAQPLRKETSKASRTQVICSETQRPASAPNLLDLKKPKVKSIPEAAQSVSTHSLLRSRTSTSSGTKSFIRPWRLQPDVQKMMSSRSSFDPVSLYQKYQEEWKRISFPGEATHSSVRWAVREKMLGADPHPLPSSRKSTSVPALKRNI